MDGFINVLKPPGMTSSDVVFFVRRLLERGTKVGHGGTLDPEAAGVLPICVGKAVRLFDYIVDKEKEYIAELWLGVKTDTQDATGEVIRSSDAVADAFAVRSALGAFEGRILQTPPMYSALKVGGRRLYEHARRGDEVEVSPREVLVHEIEYLGSTSQRAHRLRVVCGKGVYIRTLLSDIGDRLGCYGTMSFLLRSRAGIFTLDGAHTLEALAQGDPGAFLLPLDAPLAALRPVRAPLALRRAMQNGACLKGTFVPDDLMVGEVVRMYCEDEFFGIGEYRGDGEVRFRAMLAMEK